MFVFCSAGELPLVPLAVEVLDPLWFEMLPIESVLVL